MARKHATRNDRRRTFAEILEGSRLMAARRAFCRAIDASRLRKTLLRRGRHRAAAILAILKVDAVRRALELAPERVRVTVDSDFQVGLLSVRFAGVGRLHLPPATDLSRTGSASIPNADPQPQRAA